jgi:hypothetical protein
VIRVTGNVSIGGPIVVAPTSAMIHLYHMYSPGGSCFVPPLIDIPGPSASGLPPSEARMFLKPYDVSYGAQYSKAGGGSILILAAGVIDITAGGSVSATGEPGGSAPDWGRAGAGGVVVLASRAAIRNAGALTARGGNGANGDSWTNAGGGGGGGIVHLLGPSLVPGVTNVSGGAGGAGGAGPTGSSAGACGGGGGLGGATGSPGGVGQVLTTITADPIPFFVQ